MNKTAYTNLAKAWEFIENRALTNESEFVGRSRRLAEEEGLPQDCASQAKTLRLLIRITRATSVIAIGTGSVAQTMELVEGLEGAGQLTAVDSSTQGITLIRRLFHELADRTQTTLRAVNAPVNTFLPRLNAHDYDLIVVSGESANYASTLAQASRLLKPHGVIAFTDVLAFAAPDANGGVINPVDRSDKTVAMRELINTVGADEEFEVAVTPTGTGLLLAVRR